jgi:hypothetical protein
METTANNRRTDHSLSPRPLTELNAKSVNSNRGLLGSSHSSDSTIAHRQHSLSPFALRDCSGTVDDAAIVGHVGSNDQLSAFPSNSIRVGSENARSKSLAGDPRYIKKKLKKKTKHYNFVLFQKSFDK